MAYALLFLRVVVGLTLFAHGAQKLFGWWEGPGQAGTRGWLQSMGFRLPTVMALLVGLGEGSGLLFALGLVTPLAALVMATAMVVAIGSVHLPKGWWLSNGGYEYNLVLWAVAASVAGLGPGRFSIDRAIGWDDNISGVWWGVGVIVLSLLTGLFILTALRKEPAPQEAA
jgi:putative oxidoreductase